MAEKLKLVIAQRDRRIAELTAECEDLRAQIAAAKSKPKRKPKAAPEVATTTSKRGRKKKSDTE